MNLILYRIHILEMANAALCGSPTYVTKKAADRRVRSKRCSATPLDTRLSIEGDYNPRNSILESCLLKNSLSSD
jgi:hypothetical protein